ncbi:MAG: hypothetical protein U0270_17265 [Labilithrix sp.]
MSETEVLPAATLPHADRAALEKAGLRVGDVLDGKYEIQRVLGKGGMGLVLGAMHTALRQPVALGCCSCRRRSTTRSSCRASSARPAPPRC